MNEIAQKIATTLNESDPEPVGQIEQIVELLGEEQALAYLEQAIAIDTEGGMPTNEGDRNRTLGGTFFYLVRGGITWSQRRKLFPYRHLGPKPKKKQTLPAFEWDDRIRAFAQFRRKDLGEGIVEIKVVGKPMKIIERGSVTIVTIRGGAPPTLPKGLPKPPAEPTTYLILIAQKHWKKVAADITEPDNKLIVRGWPVYDRKLGTITILAQNASSIYLERARREEGEADPE